jgi:predicted dehydrogenase
MLGKGGHAIDLFRWYSESNVKKVFAVGRTTKGLIHPGSDVYDHAKAMLEFENGLVGFIEVGDVAPRACPYYYPILEILGTEGRINASDYRMVAVFASYDQNVVIPFPEQQFLSGVGSPFFEELRYFAKCVLDDVVPSYITPEDGRAVVESAVAANLSIRRGEPVSLPLP